MKNCADLPGGNLQEVIPGRLTKASRKDEMVDKDDDSELDLPEGESILDHSDAEEELPIDDNEAMASTSQRGKVPDSGT